MKLPLIFKSYYLLKRRKKKKKKKNYYFDIWDYKFFFLLFLLFHFQIDENVAREIINHRSLRHPNIIRFKEVRTLFVYLLDQFVLITLLIVLSC